MMSELIGFPIPELKNLNLTEELIEKFLSKINRGGPIPSHVPEIGNCWSWTCTSYAISNTSLGYGRVSLGGKDLMAHRVSAVIHGKRIPAGMLVLHRCDDPLCVRPDHLFIGTYDDNNQDTRQKGRARAASGDNHGSRLHPERVARGDNHPFRLRPELVRKGSQQNHAKLTDDAVREIRSHERFGNKMVEFYKEKYGVSMQLLYDVRSRKRWRHVE